MNPCNKDKAGRDYLFSEGWLNRLKERTHTQHHSLKLTAIWSANSKPLGP